MTDTEGDKKGIEIKDKEDDLDIFESNPEHTGEDEIHDSSQGS